MLNVGLEDGAGPITRGRKETKRRKTRKGRIFEKSKERRQYKTLRQTE